MATPPAIFPATAPLRYSPYVVRGQAGGCENPFAAHRVWDAAADRAIECKRPGRRIRDPVATPLKRADDGAGIVHLLIG
jgi:hypothetical protein